MAQLAARHCLRGRSRHRLSTLKQWRGVRPGSCGSLSRSSPSWSSLHWSSGWCGTGGVGSVCPQTLPPRSTDPVDTPRRRASRSARQRLPSRANIEPACPRSVTTPPCRATRPSGRSPRCGCPSRRWSSEPKSRRSARGPGARPPPVEPEPEPAAPDLDAIAPAEGRLERLRGRLAKSQNALGRSMLGLLGGGDLDEESWEEVEDTLLIADLGPVVTASVVDALRSGWPAAACAPRPTPARCCARCSSPSCSPSWTARSRRCRTTTSRRCCWSSASTAPARPPPSASWPGCWSPTGAGSCSAPPTPSGPPLPTSCRPGRRGWVPRWCVAPRAPTRRRWPSTPSTRASRPAPTSW